MKQDEARKLLTYHYGNEQNIAVAYVDKSIKWPPIKAEDHACTATKGTPWVQTILFNIISVESVLLYYLSNFGIL